MVAQARLRSGGSSSCAKLLCDDELDETLTTGTDTTGEESKKDEVERSAEDYYTRGLCFPTAAPC